VAVAAGFCDQDGGTSRLCTAATRANAIIAIIVYLKLIIAVVALFRRLREKPTGPVFPKEGGSEGRWTSDPKNK
jgi:hypothetical protein